MLLGAGTFCSVEACFYFRMFPRFYVDNRVAGFQKKRPCSQSPLHPVKPEVFGRRLQAMSAANSRGIARNTTCSKCDLYAVCVTHICCIMAPVDRSPDRVVSGSCRSLDLWSRRRQRLVDTCRQYKRVATSLRDRSSTLTTTTQKSKRQADGRRTKSQGFHGYFCLLCCFGNWGPWGYFPVK